MKSPRCAFTSFLMLFLAGFLIACAPAATEEPPGVGAKAEMGYAACAPIIEALAKYHEATGAYPDDLQGLDPAYLTSIPAEVNDHPIRYQKTETAYTLSFQYIGPGMNVCTYSPDMKWKCSGAY